MAKGNKGPKPKSIPEAWAGEEEIESNEDGSAWRVKDEESESDLPIESPKKVSAGRGASSDSKHQHRKFDKFKKGN